MTSYNRDTERGKLGEYARALIDVYRATPPGEEADELATEIRREITRLAGIDPDLAAEAELEFLDPHAGEASGWDSAWDDDTWEPTGPAGGADLGLCDPADADDDDAPIDLAEPFAGPADEDLEEQEMLDLPSWIEGQGRKYQGLATAAGEMVGTALRELASLVRLVGARDPMTALARLAALEDSRLAALWSARVN